MRAYVEAIWGWVEDDQRAMHDRGFDPSHTRIVTVGGQDAGLLIVERTAGRIYLGRIEIHPDHQGHGIGSHLIGELLREAAAAGKPVELDVLAVNPRAQSLYRRLGFHDVRGDAVRTRMRWSQRK
jgi:ribosomal protein S18 acetylase RimI-like enzyme